MKKITLLALATILILLSTSACAAMIIKLDSTGREVTELQDMLKTLGYYTGSVTGHAGPKTIEALELFQEENGLTVDGIAGPATMRKLEEIFNPGMVSSSSSASSSSSSGNADVKRAQTILKATGLYYGEITGNVGSKTQAAIKAFQKKYDLTQSGSLDSATMAKLESVYAGKTDKKEESNSQADVETVKRAQMILKELGLYYNEVTGNIGSKTQAAIKAFQKKYDLSQSGTLNKETMAKLESVYLGENEKESVPKADTEAVKLAQEILKELDLYYGEITGNIGSKTQTAIKAFQKKYGLEQSGALTEETLGKLKGVHVGGEENKQETASSAETESVKRAQTILREMDLYYGEITGNIGTKTKNAIAAFQKKHGLSGSGTLTAETISKLEAVYAADNAPQQDTADQAEKDDVIRAQTILRELDLYYGEITGNIGTKTKNAIKAFQKKYGLSETGTLTGETISKIDSIYYEENNKQEETEEEEEETIFSALRYGSTGAAVSSLQENLTKLGYYYGEVTGHYGSKTRAAVRSFQKAAGLTADGIAGKNTIAALESAIKNSTSAEGTLGGAVLDLHWFNEKSFYNSHGVKKANTITVMDVVTGKMFNCRVQSTGYHADVEPKTAADTQIMCDIYGVDDASKINYKRRAVLVKVKVSGVTYTYAASMYGEAHGSQVITDNDYEGQFCIHFRHSTTSETKIEYADNQDPIDKAVNYAVNTLGMRLVTDPDDL